MTDLHCYKCSELIVFNPNIISKNSGKRIPINPQTNQPHSCSNDFDSILEQRVSKHCISITVDKDLFERYYSQKNNQERVLNAIKQVLGVNSELIPSTPVVPKK
ncbi:MAG: hypothetical protein WEC35_03305 [Nitrosopumilaceae archaeon]